jgi:hypothetical protein
MMVCDFIDAMVGYSEGEFEKIKNQAELIRTSTAILRNTQFEQKDRLLPNELWPFTWDKNGSVKVERISEEERKIREDKQVKFLIENYPNTTE